MTALDALLDRLPRTTLVVGKGGVGKTTLASGIAALLARRGNETLLLSTDPAAALGTVIGTSVTADATPVPGWPHLNARQLAASVLRKAFLEQWRDVIAEIVDRGTYLDRADIDGMVDAAFPGIDEIFALLALAELFADHSGAYERIVIDTAPTGHTLRLLAMPDTFSALLSMLDLMQDKHRFMVRALTHRYKSDRADAFLSDMRSRIDGLRHTLGDRSALAAVIVTRDEPVVRAETARYSESLRALGVSIAGTIVNVAPSAKRAALARNDVETTEIIVERVVPPPVGINAIVDMLSVKRPPAKRSRATRGAATPAPRKRENELVAGLVRTLTIVGGKGGVGKSTVACALAIDAVGADARRTLLVSTDPAPSLADALGEDADGWIRHDEERELRDPPGLVVRQMDATAAFARLRTDYQARIDALFSAMVGRGVGLDVERDRAIVRDLLALAPPGIDELYALSILGDALAEGRFERIIVDPAPTGHLLRLLDMPAVALDWSHRLMRLMLQYRDVVALGESAQELLDFAKRTRALDTLLHDAMSCTLVIVALDEPVVRTETERLVTEVQGRGIDVGAVVWNRARETVSPLPLPAAVRQVCAEEVVPPPIGAAALRGWSQRWSTLSTKL